MVAKIFFTILTLCLAGMVASTILTFGKYDAFTWFFIVLETTGFSGLLVFIWLGPEGIKKFM